MLSGVNSHIYIPSVQREKGRKKFRLNQEELYLMNACEVLNIELGTSYSSQLVFQVKIWKILATSSNGVIHCQYFKHKNPLHEVFGYWAFYNMTYTWTFLFISLCCIEFDWFATYMKEHEPSALFLLKQSGNYSKWPVTKSKDMLLILPLSKTMYG